MTIIPFPARGKMSDMTLSADERRDVRAQADELVHRFLVAVGGDWPALGDMIESTTKEIMLRLVENRIPPDFAAAYSTAFLDEAFAEATRLRSTMTAVVGRA
jgi:hypothetical protein